MSDNPTQYGHPALPAVTDVAQSAGMIQWLKGIISVLQTGITATISGTPTVKVSDGTTTALIDATSAALYVKLRDGTTNQANYIDAANNALKVNVVAGGAGGGAVTVADGADVAEGAVADAIVAAGATGTLSAKLRRVTQGLEDLKTLIVLAAGSNIIGAVTQSGTWNVTVNTALPTGTNTLGSVKVTDGSNTSTFDSTGRTKVVEASDVIDVAGTEATPLFATIVASASGATQLVAAVASKRIRVISLALVVNAAVNVKFQSHVTPTDISGLFYCAANGGMVLPENPRGWFQTVAGEALDINLSGAVAVGGCLTYITV